MGTEPGRETYVGRGDGHVGWQDKDDADEEGPQARPDVDEPGQRAHVPRTGGEVAREQKLAYDGDTVAPVQGDGADGEHTRDGGVGSKTDQVDGDAEKDRDPDGVERSAGPGGDLDPDVGEGQHTVTGEGEDGTAESLHGCEGDELDDDQGSNGEEHGTTLAETVVEDLRDGLSHGRLEDLLHVAHAEAQDDVEEEADHVGEKHGRRDSPRSLALGLADLLGDVRSRVVVGHGPADGQETKQPAEANGSPSGLRLDVSKDIGGVVLVLGHDQQGNSAGHQDTDVEDDIELGHLLHPVGRQGIDHAGDDGQSSHDTDSVVVGDGVVEVAAHGDSGQKHLGCAVLGRSDTSDLAQEVEPSSEPVIVSAVLTILIILTVLTN